MFGSKHCLHGAFHAATKKAVKFVTRNQKPLFKAVHLHHYFNKHVCLSVLPTVCPCVRHKPTLLNQKMLLTKVVTYASVIKKIRKNQKKNSEKNCDFFSKSGTDHTGMDHTGTDRTGHGSYWAWVIPGISYNY